MNHLPLDKKAEFHKLILNFIKKRKLQIACCQECDYGFKSMLNMTH